MLRIRRLGGETILSAGSLCLVVAGMTVINDDVRRHVIGMLSGDRATELAFVTGPAEQLGRRLLTIFADYQAAHGPLVAFGVVAAVLLGFMLCT